MAHHDLKCWPEYFDEVVKCTKNFELRYDDRNYQPGDTVTLKKFEPCRRCKGTGLIFRDRAPSLTCGRCLGEKGMYLGPETSARIGYVLRGDHLHPQLGTGFCIFSLKPL